MSKKTRHIYTPGELQLIAETPSNQLLAKAFGVTPAAIAKQRERTPGAVRGTRYSLANAKKLFLTTMLDAAVRLDVTLVDDMQRKNASSPILVTVVKAGSMGTVNSTRSTNLTMDEDFTFREMILEGKNINTALGLLQQKFPNLPAGTIISEYTELEKEINAQSVPTATNANTVVFNQRELEEIIKDVTLELHFIATGKADKYIPTHLPNKLSKYASADVIAKREQLKSEIVAAAMIITAPAQQKSNIDLELFKLMQTNLLPGQRLVVDGSKLILEQA